MSMLFAHFEAFFAHVGAFFAHFGALFAQFVVFLENEQKGHRNVQKQCRNIQLEFVFFSTPFVEIIHANMPKELRNCKIKLNGVPNTKKWHHI